MEIMVPENVVECLEQLDKLMKEYPLVIPLPAAAEFLHMDQVSLRRGIANGRFGGEGWKVNTRNEFYISSARFYMYFMAPWANTGVLKIGGSENG